jgi:hypothetical protein
LPQPGHWNLPLPLQIWHQLINRGAASGITGHRALEHVVVKTTSLRPQYRDYAFHRQRALRGVGRHAILAFINAN